MVRFAEGEVIPFSRCRAAEWNMRNNPRFFCILALALIALTACASDAGGRVVHDTRDLVVEAQVPESGFWYVAEATAADAVDDVELDVAPMFEGDTPPAPSSGLAPMRVAHTWPADQELIELDFEVTSLDAAENAEVRCSVYFDGKLVVENTAVGASPVAVCEGEFSLSDFR